MTLKVARMSDAGAFLDAGTGNTSDDILLHKLQQTSEINVGDEVKVYLYLDPNKRLTASMKLPKMREGQLGYVRVLSVTRDGGFVDIGAERGVFLPYSQMRGHVNPGQLVWVRLYREIIDILSIRNKCILLLQTHRNVNTSILAQIGYTAGNLLTEVKSATGHFTAMQESNEALIGEKEEAFRQDIINRAGNLVTNL